MDSMNKNKKKSGAGKAFLEILGALADGAVACQNQKLLNFIIESFKKGTMTCKISGSNLAFTTPQFEGTVTITRMNELEKLLKDNFPNFDSIDIRLNQVTLNYNTNIL